LGLAFGLQSAAIAQAQEHVLMESKRAQIRPAGSTQFRMAKAGDFVSGADELKIAGGGKVIVICANMKQATFTTSGKISRQCPSSSTRANDNRSLVRVVVDWFRGKPLPTSLGGSRSGLADIPYVLTPRKSMILTTHPEIRWNTVDGASSYTISLSHPEFEAIAWEVAAENLNYQYPLNQPELVSGERYTLKITTDNFVASTEDGQTVWLQVLGKAEQQELFALLEELRQQDFSPSTEIVIESILYEEFELYSNAIAILSGYLRENESAIAVRERLAELYGTIGLLPEQEQQYQQIVRLTKGEITESRAIALGQLADIAALREEHEIAETYLAESQAIYQQLGYPF